VVALAAALGSVYGLGMGFLVLAGGVLLGVILLFRGSLLSLTSEAPMTLEEALTLSAPSAEEEQKQAVLRALKDLDYERSVGKISDQDYQELSQRYRTDAKALLLAVDRDMAPALERAEALLASRLNRGTAPRSEAARNETPSSGSSEVPSGNVCSECNTENDVDARFCKSCGVALSKEAT
jgi:hypothetical protein